MEDADSGISDLCCTEHSGTGQPGEQAGKESGDGSPCLWYRFFKGSFSFFKRSQAVYSYLQTSTGFMLRLIGLDKSEARDVVGQQTVHF